MKISTKPRLLGHSTTWGRLILCVVFSVICMLVVADIFSSRFRFCGDGRLYKCLPFTLYLLDKWQIKPVTGNYYAFRTKANAFFDEGELIGKRFDAGFLDHVEITSDEMIKVNGRTVAKGLQLAARLNHERSDFYGSALIEKDEFFALGTTIDSYDSRYWGPVNETQIVGRLYPVF